MSGDDLDSIEKQIEALKDAGRKSSRDCDDETSSQILATGERNAKLARLYIERADAQRRQFKASIRRRAALLAKKDGKP